MPFPEENQPRNRIRLAPAPAYLAFLLLAISAVAILLLFPPPEHESLAPAALLLAVAAGFLALPVVLQARQRLALEFPAAVKRLGDQMADFETLRRDLFRLRQENKGLLQHVEKLQAQTAAQYDQLARSALELAERIRQHEGDIIRLRQDVGELNRLGDRWVAVTQDFFVTLEGLLSHDGVDRTARDAVESLLARYESKLIPLGFTVIRPKPGDPFEESLHEAKASAPSEEHPPGAVTACLKWGFRKPSDEIVRAHVTIAAPPPPPPAPPEQPDQPATEGIGQVAMEPPAATPACDEPDQPATEETGQRGKETPAATLAPADTPSASLQGSPETPGPQAAAPLPVEAASVQQPPEHDVTTQPQHPAEPADPEQPETEPGASAGGTELKAMLPEARPPEQGDVEPPPATESEADDPGTAEPPAKPPKRRRFQGLGSLLRRWRGAGDHHEQNGPKGGPRTPA
jgi:molecular chaperone GrpE (heat shock protein)